jgi:hypothetical protein
MTRPLEESRSFRHWSMAVVGASPTLLWRPQMSAFEGKADISEKLRRARQSYGYTLEWSATLNRPKAVLNREPLRVTG